MSQHVPVTLLPAAPYGANRVEWQLHTTVLRPRDDFLILFPLSTLLKAPTLMWKVLSNTPVKSSSRVHEVPSPLLHSQDMFLFTSLLSQEYARSACFSNLFSVFFTSYYVKSSWNVSTFGSHCPCFITDGLFYVMKEMRKKWIKTYFGHAYMCLGGLVIY